MWHALHTVAAGALPREESLIVDPTRSANTVFIISSHRDKHLVQAVREGLVGADIEVWDADTIPPGNRISAAIQDGIRSAKIVILVLSRDALENTYTQIEIAAAVAAAETDDDKRLIPVYIDGAVPNGLLSAYQPLVATSTNPDELVRSLLTTIEKHEVTNKAAGRDAEFDRLNAIAAAQERMRHEESARRHVIPGSHIRSGTDYRSSPPRSRVGSLPLMLVLVLAVGGAIFGIWGHITPSATFLFCLLGLASLLTAFLLGYWAGASARGSK